MESPNSKCAGLTPIVTTTMMPVVNVHCLRHNKCHVTYTMTTQMCLTCVERLMSDVRSVYRCPHGYSAGECGHKVHWIISGLEELIAGIKNGEGRLNR